MWTKIVNPESGRKVSIYGKTGQNVLKNYLYQLGGKQRGGGWVTESEVDPTATPDELEQELFRQPNLLIPAVGRRVCITTFDGRSRVGHLQMVDTGPGFIEVNIDGDSFRSWGLFGPFFGQDIANPFQKIEVWEEEQKKRPKSAMKTGKRQQT